MILQTQNKHSIVFKSEFFAYFCFVVAFAVFKYLAYIFVLYFVLDMYLKMLLLVVVGYNKQHLLHVLSHF